MVDRMSSRESLRFSGLNSDDGLNGTGFHGKDFARVERGYGQHDDDLKNLLLVNLDLIQHQQELLVANERTILSLKQENERLKSRLDRIERRMSLVNQKGSPNITASSLPYDSSSSRHRTETRPTRSACRKLNLDSTEVVSESSYKIEDVATKTDPEPIINTGMEEKTEPVDRKNQVMRVTSRKPLAQTPSGKGKMSRRSETLQSVSDAETPQKVPKLEDVSEKAEKKEERFRRRVRKNSELLMTGALYYVPVLTTVNAEEDSDEDVKPLEQNQILVPNWRTKHLTSLYVMEGTENLDDRVFLKRHQKSEAEEKRRKRWDIQRLKDLQLLRRQQLKTDADMKTKNDILTFLPQLEKALYVEVNDKIPVSAFGYPVPTVDKQEFHVPWYNVNKEPTTKNKRSRKT